MKKLKEAIRAIKKATEALDDLQEDTRAKHFERSVYELNKTRDALIKRLNEQNK